MPFAAYILSYTVAGNLNSNYIRLLHLEQHTLCKCGLLKQTTLHVAWHGYQIKGINIHFVIKDQRRLSPRLYFPLFPMRLLSGHLLNLVCWCRLLSQRRLSSCRQPFRPPPPPPHTHTIHITNQLRPYFSKCFLPKLLVKSNGSIYRLTKFTEITMTMNALKFSQRRAK